MKQPTIEERREQLRKLYQERPDLRKIIVRMNRALEIAEELRARKRGQNW